MANFFEKLKKGMGIEIPSEQNEEEKEEQVQISQPLSKTGRDLKKKLAKKNQGVEAETDKEEIEEKKEKWPEPEGELAVDVYQTDEELVIQSAVAGVKPEELNVSLEGDVLSIEGERKKPKEEEEADYLIQECYWGRFSRKIILPAEINAEKIDATFKDGILTIRIQKATKERKKKIVVKG